MKSVDSHRDCGGQGMSGSRSLSLSSVRVLGHAAFKQQVGLAGRSHPQFAKK